MPATGPLTIGVLGVGRIGSMHAELLHHRVPEAELVGVFDVAPERAEAVAGELGVETWRSAEAALADDRIGAVAIATSTDTHVETIVAAAEAGKAIFCEKPLSLDRAELDRALAAVADAGVPLQVGFNRRFDQGHAAVKAAVADGTIGQLRQLRITSRDPTPPPLDYVRVSGGIFLDMTIHDFDMARFVTGSEVTEVYARGTVTVDPGIGAVGDLDTVVVVLAHADGTMTTIDNCRQAAYGYDQRVEAFGSAGMATSGNQVEHHTIVHTGDGGQQAPIPHFFQDRYIPAYLAQWQAFVAAVADGGPTPVTGADGRAPLLMGLAAGMSIAENRPVGLDEVG